jgi:hypothetical protein
MTDSLPLISIIIVNFDTPEITRECLNSLTKIKAEEFDYQIIVVDNGSQQTLKLPKKINNQPIDLIRTEANIGFTGGNNLGISHAVKTYNPDYFLLLNSDTTVDKDFLHELFLCIQGKNRGIASSKILFEKNYEFYKNDYPKQYLGKIVWFAGGVIDWQNLMAFHRGVDEVDRDQFDHLTETDFATGCSMLLKRELIEEVGILDKKYFLYLEDVDYSLRASKKGYKIVFCPQSVVYHKNAGSSDGSGSRVHLYYQTRNRLLFFFKYSSWRRKMTVIRFAFDRLLNGSPIERQAVSDFFLNRYGKQPVI